MTSIIITIWVLLVLRLADGELLKSEVKVWPSERECRYAGARIAIDDDLERNAFSPNRGMLHVGCYPVRTRKAVPKNVDLPKPEPHDDEDLDE